MYFRNYYCWLGIMFNNSSRDDHLICLLFVNEKVIDEGVVDEIVVDELASFCGMSFSLVSFPSPSPIPSTV
jgi:hypothetical protein